MARQERPLRDARITLRLTQEIRAKVTGAAAADGVSEAEWIRGVVVRALREKDAKVRR